MQLIHTFIRLFIAPSVYANCSYFVHVVFKNQGFRGLSRARGTTVTVTVKFSVSVLKLSTVHVHDLHPRTLLTRVSHRVRTSLPTIDRIILCNRFVLNLYWVVNMSIVSSQKFTFTITIQQIMHRGR